MAIGLVQKLTATGGTATNITCVFVGATTIGNLLVLGLCDNNTNIITSVTDAGGNTWTRAVDAVVNNPRVSIWYTLSTAVAGTITIHNTSNAGQLSVVGAEFSGVGSGAPITSPGNGTGTAASSGAASGLAAGSLAFGVVGFNGLASVTYAVTTGYTLGTKYNATNANTVAFDYKLSSGTSETDAPTLGASETWRSAIAVFAAAAAPPANAPTLVRQQVGAPSGNPANLTITAPADGNCLIVTLWSVDVAVTALTLTGATFTKLVSRSGSNIIGAGEIAVWAAPNVSGAGTALSFTGNNADGVWCNVQEWSGLPATLVTDGTNNATGSSTAPVSGSITTTNATDLIIACAAFHQAATSAGPGAGFTALTSEVAAGYSLASAYQITSSTATAQAAWTIVTAQWDGVIVAMKLADLFVPYSPVMPPMIAQ